MPKRLLPLLALAVAASASANPAIVPYDGKAENVTAAAYSVLRAVRQRAPDSFERGAQLTDAEVDQLVAAIRRDGKLDESERDLVSELTQGVVRGVNVYSGTAASGQGRLHFFPLSDPARSRLYAVNDMYTPPPPPPSPPSDPRLVDGKVTLLDPEVFGVLEQIRRRNPGILQDVDSRQLVAAIRRDGKIDPVEQDLLRELTQTQFRQVTVSPGGTGNSARRVTMFPASGTAKQALMSILSPALDLDQAFALGSPGWTQIVAEYRKGGAQEARVLSFVTGKVAAEWRNSNMGNGYKPLRDLIGRLYGYSNAPAGDVNGGKSLLYAACKAVDSSDAGRMPDFMYNWVRPGGYL